MIRLLACLLAVVALAGCGGTRETREPDVVVVGSATPAEGEAQGGAGPVRIWVVTHGQASSAFWTIVRNGVDDYKELGALTHVGQTEFIAGEGAGERLAQEGVDNALCINQEVGNVGLDRRCAGFARAMREAGGSSRVVAIDTKDPDASRAQIKSTASRPGVDGVLTLGLDAAELAIEVAPVGATLGTFDYSPAVLRAVRTGRMEFAVDQQPYLQGYLPVVFLAERARYGLFPAQGEVVPTGPSFITSENAAQAERLSLLGIR